MMTDSMFTDKLYTGQRDVGLGLYHYNARFYDPLLKRFISADTIVSNAKDPQTLNRYAYTLNSPMRYVDPSGHMVSDDAY
jgi:RHS repeat-associated protein